jgi:hypothetical protein
MGLFYLYAEALVKEYGPGICITWHRLLRRTLVAEVILFESLNNLEINFPSFRLCFAQHSFCSINE